MFEWTVQLTQSIRQQRVDEDLTRFRELLQGLQFGNIQDESLQFLLRQVCDRLDPNTQMEFEQALWIYATWAAVSDFNIETLQATGLPVLQIEALHTPAKAKSSPDDDAEGLHPELFVSKGCRIMLVSNLLVLCRLVNGALGTLIDIV